MMQRKIATLVLAAAVLLGAGTGAVATQFRADEDTAPAGGEATAGPTAPEDFEITPGAVGPVEAGMTKDEAVATGYLEVALPPVVDGCPTLPLAWKAAYAEVFDVLTAGNGDILSIGVRGGATTAEGFGVGTTWGELKGSVDEPVEAGFGGQSGAFVHDAENAGWIGFLLDASPAELTDDSTVTFVEVTKGARPDLQRSGC